MIQSLRARRRETAVTDRQAQRRSTLSRSAFAARFSGAVRHPPLQYLTAWRSNFAAEHLRGATASTPEIAAKVGYGSEAALNRASKAQFSTTPAAFRDAAHTSVPDNLTWREGMRRRCATSAPFAHGGCCSDFATGRSVPPVVSFRKLPTTRAAR